MLYVFDTSSIIVLGHFFPSRFPSFWTSLQSYVDSGLMISVREVRKELERYGNRPHMEKWIENNKSIFSIPSAEETAFVREIFTVPHFQQLVSERQRLKGSPVADPFVIAAARIRGGCVVTEETFRDNAAKIPNVCQHFEVPWTHLEGFMEREGWSF